MKKLLIILVILYFSQNIFSQNINRLKNNILNSQYKETISEAEKFSMLFPDNPKIYYYEGYAYQSLNRYKDAEKYFKKAFLLDSFNTRFINTFAKISEINRKPTKAKILYQKTLEIDSLNFTALNNLSKLFLNQKKYNNALHIFLILSKQDTSNAYYDRKIGYCYLKLSAVKSGIYYYKKAYSKDSSNLYNIKSLASVYLKTKKFDNAIKICEKGIIKDSAFSDFYKLKGDAHFAKNHFFRAVPDYKKAIQLGDSSYNLQKRLGIALCEIKKFKEALPYNIFTYKKDSSSYSNTMYLCRTYLGLKDYDNSLKFADKTLKLIRFAKRIEYNIFDLKATAYTEKEKYLQALKMYEKQKNIFELNPKYFNLRNTYNSALIFDKLNDKKNALKYYKNIVNYYENHSSDKDNPYYKYSKQRVTKLKEDIFFEGD